MGVERLVEVDRDSSILPGSGRWVHEVDRTRMLYRRFVTS